MNNKIKQLLEKVKTLKPDNDLAMIHTILKEIKKLLILTLLVSELEDVHELIEPGKMKPEPQPEPQISRAAMLEQLEDITTTTKEEDGTRMYLLHRPTENFEYNESADNVEYDSAADSEWYAEAMSGEINQESQNPVVSCWIPEAKIIGTDKPHPNTGTWGDMGKNPFAESYKVIVKPGKYRIYQELRQRR